jgi:hypothetical protein
MQKHRGVRSSFVAAAMLASPLGCGEPRTATGPGGLAPPASGVDAGDYLERARACAADAECQYLGDFCNEGCAVTVNRKESDAVRARLLSPRRECAMDCPPVSAPMCRRGRCESPER